METVEQGTQSAPAVQVDEWSRERVVVLTGLILFLGGIVLLIMAGTGIFDDEPENPGGRDVDLSPPVEQVTFVEDVPITMTGPSPALSRDDGRRTIATPKVVERSRWRTRLER